MFWPREYDCALPVCTAIATATPASSTEAAKGMRLIFYPPSINVVRPDNPPRVRVQACGDPKGSPYK